MKAVQARTRISLRNILFATDFSPAAGTAAPFAIQIARSYGAKMYGVHVNPFDNYTAAAPDAWAAMAEAAERQTKEHAQRLNEQLKGVEHQVVIGEGNIWEVISNLRNMRIGAWISFRLAVRLWDMSVSKRRQNLATAVTCSADPNHDMSFCLCHKLRTTRWDHESHRNRNTNCAEKHPSFNGFLGAI